MNLAPSTRMLTVASGKGGVGKTSLTLNLATLLAKKGEKVLVIDGDIGLANADVQLNLTPKHDLADIFDGTATIEQALTAAPQGFHLLAGRAGHAGLANLPLPKLHEFFNQLAPISSRFTTILIDAAAGVSPHTLTLCAQSTATLLVTTPDPSSLTDAYALIKLLWQNHGTSNAHLIVNQATQREAQTVLTRLATAMQNFLKLPAIQLLGNIPADRLYATAVKTHQLAAQAYPQTPAVEALQKLLPHLPK